MKFDLEDRLIKFTAAVLDFAEQMPDTREANHLCGQLIRSGTAPALLYGEANAAESTADFIHKMGIALKELKETNTCLTIVHLRSVKPSDQLNHLLDENRQLISIFGASINTARKKLKPKP